MAKSVLICRDFWPNAGAIGNGLLELAELLSQKYDSNIITMSDLDLNNFYKGNFNRKHKNIKFHRLRPLTSSKSSIPLRIFEIIYFGLAVFFYLAKLKPEKIYISSNPPIFIPFLVALYSKLFNGKFYYHAQDIHPEATKVVFNVPSFLFTWLQRIDNFVLSNASKIITLSKDMEGTLKKRSSSIADIVLVDNPALNASFERSAKINGCVFCGNAGRLQLIPTVIRAIQEYLDEHENLEFCFVGGGVYAADLAEMSKKYKNFKYHGYVSPEKAIEITSLYKWALLSIDQNVLSYAYPSKIPTYISAGCNIICITDNNTHLSKWILDNQIGISVGPNVEKIKAAFKNLNDTKVEVDQFYKFPSVSDFALRLNDIIIEDN